MSFNASQYLRNYPELEEAFKTHPVLSAYDDPYEAAQVHYNKYGVNEGRTSEAPEGSEFTDDNYFDTKRFSDLLEKLEGSKKRQQRQKSVEGRRDIFAGGLANMMGNF